MEILESFSPMSVSGIIMENETAVHRITALQMWYKLEKKTWDFLSVHRIWYSVFAKPKAKNVINLLYATKMKNPDHKNSHYVSSCRT